MPSLLSQFDDSFISLFNLHPSFDHLFHHYIFFGGHGSGKLSQMLLLIHSLQPSFNKSHHKLFSIYDKHSYSFLFYDSHFELDMGLLGCNSKIIWHDILSQIFDIISLKHFKRAFIVHARETPKSVKYKNNDFISFNNEY